MVTKRYMYKHMRMQYIATVHKNKLQMNSAREYRDEYTRAA